MAIPCSRSDTDDVILAWSYEIDFLKRLALTRLFAGVLSVHPPTPCLPSFPRFLVETSTVAVRIF